MHVLIDTNIYLADPTLSSPEFTALKNYLEKTKSNILIPQVIHDETKKNLHATGYTLSRELKGHLAYRMGLLQESAIDKTFLADRLTDTFDQFVKQFPTKILSLDGITIEMMVEKSLKERAPFKPSSQGFRDAVIWETFLHYLSQSIDNVCFITRNSKDFGKDSLLPSMIEDITKLESETRVFYKNDLRSFLTEFANTIDFIDLGYIMHAVEMDVLALGETVDPQKVETFRNDAQQYVVVKADYYDYEIEDHYILNEKAETFTVYVNARLDFTIDVEMLMDENYNFIMSSDILSTGPSDPDIGWLDIGIYLEINRETRLVTDKTIDL